MILILMNIGDIYKIINIAGGFHFPFFILS